MPTQGNMDSTEFGDRSSATDDATSQNEAEIYQRLSALEIGPRSGPEEDLRTTPLMTLAVKNDVDEKLERQDAEGIFTKYAVLGFHAGSHHAICANEPILMNVNAPNSTFICGSQGSGKSYTLSCMLENCLIANRRIGNLCEPVAGVAFQYSLDSSSSVAEAAYLCSLGIRINVLVSQSNEHVLREAYKKIPGAEQSVSVTPLLFRSSDLSIDRMHRLMAFADKESTMPLYMSVALRILRRMAIDAKGSAFDYNAFKRALEGENFTKEQFNPLYLRLELLESFLNLSERGNRISSPSPFSLQPGSLTIVDLTDPFMDPATACVLFDICLSLIKEQRPQSGLVVVLDEAHKFMTTSLAASNFTERLLGTIREQRHNATRVIIATQEPTISEKLLDLCSVSIIHRFTSPAWFVSVRNHLGAASISRFSGSQDHPMFDQILNLQTGESLVFAPSASVYLEKTGQVSRLGATALKMRTRKRLGSDGGMSVLSTTRRGSYPAWEGLQTSPAIREHRLEAGSSEGAHHSTNVLDIQTFSPGDTIDVTPQLVRPTSGASKLHMTRGISTLNPRRSHLLLICCSCENIVLIEFRAHLLPHLTDIDQENLQGGSAYATCIKCQSGKVGEEKRALKMFDFARSKEFHNGLLNIDDDLRTDLSTSLRVELGHDMTSLLRNGRPLYVFLRIVQRAINDRDLLYIVQHTPALNGISGLSVRISKHEDGTFFKAALQPRSSNP